MARPAKPWYWEARDQWCAWIDRKRITLVAGKRNRNEAYRRFLELTAAKGDKVASSRSTGREVCSLFLEHARQNLKSTTTIAYASHLKPFGEFCGTRDASDIKPKDVSQWVSTHEWSDTTRYNAITAIKVAWAWALGAGHITLNGLKEMKRPRPTRREEIPDTKDLAKFLAAATGPFGEFVTFLNETGCRPGEAMKLERRHVDLENGEVRYRIGEDKTSGKTGRRRVIHLNKPALAKLTKLCLLHPTGPLFRNSKGNAWNRNAVRCAVARIRGRTGLDDRTVAYALRHNYITDALARGMSIATVAELTGTSPEMIARVYSHLSDKKALLMKAANEVRPAPPPED